MWVRSQDGKQLTKCNAFYMKPVSGKSINIEQTTSCYYVIYGVSNSDEVFLGVYNDKEKAITVLDMIGSTVKTVFQIP